MLDGVSCLFELSVCPNNGTHLVYVGFDEEEVKGFFGFRSEVEIDEEISLKVVYNQNV